MQPDPRRDEAVHEFRLEGAGLLVGGSVLIALLAGMFLLGRWVERRAAPAGGAAGPLDHVAVESPPAEAARNLNVFDGGPDQGRTLEPGREVGAPPPVPAPSPRPVGAGPYWVQVFAGRDRAGAEDLVAALERAGFPVRLATEREGRDSLYRVRVGGYASEAQAQEGVARLRAAGYRGAFVAREN